MTGSKRAVFASAFAVLLTAFALRPLYVDLHWLPATIGAVLLASSIGILARKTGAPLLATTILAPAAGLCYVTALYTRAKALAGFLPTGASLRDLRTLFKAATLDIRTLAPPVPTHHGLVLIGATGVFGCAVLVDVLAVSLRRPAVAGLPLLALFAVPSGILTKGLGLGAFLAAAVGWITLLLVEGRDRVGLWGRTLGRRERVEAGGTDRYTPDAIAVTGRRIGAAAVSLAVILPLTLPPLHGGLLHSTGSGAGDGGESTSTTVYPPIVTLERRLHAPGTTVLLTVTSDAPTYLRMTALDVYDQGKFTLGQIGATASGAVSNGIPAAPGPTDGVVVPLHATVSVSRDLAEPYLPLPYAPRRVAVSGDWRTSQQTMTVFSNRTNTRGISYDVDALVPYPDVQTLRNEGPVSSFPSLLSFEPDLLLPVIAPGVHTLVDRITGKAQTAYDQVLAIQDYLRGPAFHYDLTAPGFATSKSLDPLSDFLLTSRRGYCEQFATAMAVMVRILGLPARVAIGFTAGTAQRNHSYIVTNHDAHSWPEVFFPRAGWVRFEPTPLDSSRALVPSYAGGAVQPLPSASAGVGASGQPLPAITPSARPITAADRAERAQTATALAATHRASTRSIFTRWAALALLLVLLVVGIGPGVTRFTLRRRRLAGSSGPQAAWVELLDTAEDIRLRLPLGGSPRVIASVLSVSMPTGPARDALGRLAFAEERRRYAPTSPAPTSSTPTSSTHVEGSSFGEDALAVRRGLLLSAGRRGALRALLVPPSQLRRLTAATGERRADAFATIDRIVNQLGAALTWAPRTVLSRLRALTGTNNHRGWPDG